jgi:hypothetical protein
MNLADAVTGDYTFKPSRWSRFKSVIRRAARFLFEADETYYDTGFSWADSKQEEP